MQLIEKEKILRFNIYKKTTVKRLTFIFKENIA
jgi:hypothetical protein